MEPSLQAGGCYTVTRIPKESLEVVARLYEDAKQGKKPSTERLRLFLLVWVSGLGNTNVEFLFLPDKVSRDDNLGSWILRGALLGTSMDMAERRGMLPALLGKAYVTYHTKRPELCELTIQSPGGSAEWPSLMMDDVFENDTQTQPRGPLSSRDELVLPKLDPAFD